MLYYLRIFPGTRMPKIVVNYSTSKTKSLEDSTILCSCLKMITVERSDDKFDQAPPVFTEKEPLQGFPNGVNPVSGEIGGPRGKQNQIKLLKNLFNS